MVNPANCTGERYVTWMLPSAALIVMFDTYLVLVNPAAH